MLESQPEQRLEAWAVVYEDGYETTFGDGEYHYLWNLFDSREAAQADIDRNYQACVGAYRQWARLEIREMAVVLRDGQLVLELRREARDDYSDDAVYAMLEERCRGFVRTSFDLECLVAWDAHWLVEVGKLTHFFCYTEQAVGEILASFGANAKVHPVDSIREGLPRKVISAAQWKAGTRVA